MPCIADVRIATLLEVGVAVTGGGAEGAKDLEFRELFGLSKTNEVLLLFCCVVVCIVFIVGRE